MDVLKITSKVSKYFRANNARKIITKTFQKWPHLVTLWCVIQTFNDELDQEVVDVETKDAIVARRRQTDLKQNRKKTLSLSQCDLVKSCQMSI